MIDKESNSFKDLEKIPLETVLKINGTVLQKIQRDCKIKTISTGEIEIKIKTHEILGITKELPCQFLLIKNIQKK